MRKVRTYAIVIVVATLGYVILQHNPFYRLVYTVDTWDGWCRQLLGGSHPGFAVGFDHRAIRADFVKICNEGTVASVSRDWLGGAKRSDKVVKEFERLKMIGAWAKDNDLYLANQLLITDRELGMDQFRDWERTCRQRAASKWLIDAQADHRIPDDEYCLWMTIVDHFSALVLVGPDERTRKIPLEFRFRQELK